jgi:CspA family cold shock protein
MTTGTVKFFNTQKGFGFIISNNGGKEIFVHKTNTVDNLNEGDLVEFDVEETQKGLSAINVTKI